MSRNKAGNKSSKKKRKFIINRHNSSSKNKNPRTKRCSNPFNLKGHPGSDFRKPSKEMLNKFPELDLNVRLCYKCRNYNGSQFITSVENNCNSLTNIEQPMDQGGETENVEVGISALHKEGISVENERLNDLGKIFENLKATISTMDQNEPLRLRLLTLAPDHWSERKIAKEFDVSRRIAHNAKILKERQGVMGEVLSKRGKNLPQETVDKIMKFFEMEDNSRIMPSMKDTVSMVIENKKIKVQKRLLLFNLKELFVLYKESHPENPVSFSIFCKLRPKNCILLGQSGTHSTCVCVTHQNVKLMLQAINLKDLTQSGTKLCDYKDCIKMIVCKDATDECYLEKCNKCPGTEKLRQYLDEILVKACIEEIKYALWTDTDRSTLLTVVSSTDNYLDKLCEKMNKLKIHSFVAKKQSEFIKYKKNNLSNTEVLVTFDFAENLTYSIQDASQAFHWNNDQCTVFPCIYYYKKNSQVIQKNCIFLSESRKHNTTAVYTIQKQLIDEIKKEVSKVKKIMYVSDGAKQHFKNKYQMANLKNHQKDFNVKAEWHFSATAHGKCACDGLGASFKREVYRASLKAKATSPLITIKAVLSWARKNYKGAKIFHFSRTEHDMNERKLKGRFEKAEALNGISNQHSFMISENQTVHMNNYSKIIP